MRDNKNLTKEDIESIKAYAKEVRETFDGIFKAAKNAFKDGPRLLNRFQRAIDELLRVGRGKFRAVDEVHNELCVAAAILQNPDPKFSVVEYEPPLTGCLKSIDFCARTTDELTLFADVKTIKPIPKDRWEQYEKAQKGGWFPENVELLLSKEWLGGELWHNSFAARSRFLEYALELEQKIADCSLHGEKFFFVLVLCGEGFYWHEDQLEDFVSYYFSGVHRYDDPFSKAEAKYMDEKNLTLSRTISQFACMSRSQGEIHKNRLNWNVRPPRDPSFF